MCATMAQQPPKTRATFTPETPRKLRGLRMGFQEVARRLHCLKISLCRCRKPTRFRTLSPLRKRHLFCHFGQSLILATINRPTIRPLTLWGGMTVTDRQRAFLKREPLVTEEDLHLIQTHLLRHLTYCRTAALKATCIAPRPSAPAMDTPPT